jgi:hypothetical protein
MSIIGFAEISGIDVLPICSIAMIVPPKVFLRILFSSSKSSAHFGLCGTSFTIPLFKPIIVNPF